MTLASPHRRSWRSSLLALPVLLAGCQFGAGGTAAAVTRWPVPLPPAVRAQQPVLWVALAAHLGQQPLRLEAAAGELELEDARGARWRGRRLTLRWRPQPLAQPLALQRAVLGPFSSFESAEQAAQAWRSQGARGVLIARPRDWEVWAEPGAPALADQPLRQEQRLIRERLVPQLMQGQQARSLEGPLQLRAPQGLRWQGGVFGGPFRLQADAHGGWTLVEQVPLERYLRGVVPHEIGAGAPAAALAAQAVLARTWAVRNQHRFAVDGYHLCADTQCQVYSDPRQAGTAVQRALAATSGQVLSWQGRPIHAVYHASNGGMAAGFEEAWRGDPLPYLKPFADGPATFAAAHPLPGGAEAPLRRLLQTGAGAHGTAHPLFRWTRRLDRAQISRALGPQATALGELHQVQVLQRGPSGRVLSLGLQGSRGRVVLQRDAIRRNLRALPSTLFVVRSLGSGVWLFEGGGFGHGAGLSQAGATDLARRGWSVERILRHYYPGTSLVPLQRLQSQP